MPSFAELRAKAEAAAVSAKTTANSKLAAYRGDQPPSKPVYTPPPPRPPVKPDIPHTSRPLTSGDDVHTETASNDTDQTAHLSPEIQTLIENKLVFFDFLDQVCNHLCFRSLTVPLTSCQYFASHGYNTHEGIGLDTPTRIESPEEESPEEESPEEESPEGEELQPPEPVSQDIAQIEEPVRQGDIIPPPLPPSGPRQRPRPPVPRSLPPTLEAHARKVSEYKAPDTLPQVSSTERVSLPGSPPPPITAPTPAPNAAPPQGMYSSRKEQGLPAAPPTEPSLATSSETEAKVKKGRRFSKIVKMVSGSTPSTPTASAPRPSPGPLPPPVPSASTKPSVSDTSLSSATLGIPPPTFSSNASGGLFDYMPKAGRKSAENECSAARFVQFFDRNVKWGGKVSSKRYTSLLMRAYFSQICGTRQRTRMPVPRPLWAASKRGGEGARWDLKRRNGGFSQRRLVPWNGSGWDMLSVDPSGEPFQLLNPMQLFQDHSMAWYKVTWKVVMLPYRGSNPDLHNR